MPTELQIHLDACRACRQRLEQLKAEVAVLRQVASDTNLSSLPFPAGEAPPSNPRITTIGKYLIVGELGEGAQADVYLAVHLTLGREVVLVTGRELDRLTRCTRPVNRRSHQTRPGFGGFLI